MTLVNRILLLAAAALAATSAGAFPTSPDSTAALKTRHAALREKLDHNAFGRPVYLEAREEGKTQKGDVYAVLEYPYAVVSRGLDDARHWCDVLILPANTKHCHASGPGAESALALRIGRKAETDAKDAHAIGFRYHLESKAADYFRATLDAGDGPLGTRDFRIVLEATPIDERRTFVHLGYSYAYSSMARLAMQAYLATAGAQKVGFTVVGRDSQGNPKYVGGLPGATERNTMRYFLAIDAYLGSLAVPEPQRVEKRLNDWFVAAAKYPLQLSELDRGEYMEMKRRETAALKQAL